MTTTKTTKYKCFNCGGHSIMTTLKDYHCMDCGIFSDDNTAPYGEGHSLQMDILGEMRQRRARDDNAPRWIKLYMIVLVVSLIIILVHPYIIKLVENI